MGSIARTAAPVLLASTLSLAVAGCGDSGPEYPHAKLSGAVSLDGAPVETGRVTFMPTGGAAGQPVSADIAAGRYDARDVPVGEMTVTFSITQGTGQMITEGDRAPYPEIVSIVPSRYAQGIPLQVTANNSAQDFALTTSKETP